MSARRGRSAESRRRHNGRRCAAAYDAAAWCPHMWATAAAHDTHTQTAPTWVANSMKCGCGLTTSFSSGTNSSRLSSSSLQRAARALDLISSQLMQHRTALYTERVPTCARTDTQLYMHACSVHAQPSTHSPARMQPYLARGSSPAQHTRARASERLRVCHVGREVRVQQRVHRVPYAQHGVRAYTRTHARTHHTPHTHTHLLSASSTSLGARFSSS